MPESDGLTAARATSPVALTVAIALVGACCALTSPTMAPFAGGVVPWPAHGLVIAVLLAAPRRARVATAVALAVTVLLALVPAGHDAGLSLARLAAAVALLMAQAILVVVLYDRVVGETSPLAGTQAYARMLFAILVGALPLAVIAGAVLRAADTVPDYSTWTWWTAAASSGTALAGVVLGLFPGAAEDGDARSPRSLEFALLVLGYAFALASAFAEVGPFAGQVTPALAALPFLVWGGMRFGLRGYAVIAALLIVSVMLSTWFDLGPFGRFDEDKLARFRRAWIYVASLVGPAMIFPVALAERAAADRRTRSALAQLRSVFAGAGDRIAAVDRGLVIIAANPSWIASFDQLYGFRPEAGMRIQQLYEGREHEGDVTVALWRRALAGEGFTVARTFTGRDGAQEEFEVTYAPVRDDAGEIVGASQVMRSIAARHRREMEEAESRRLESIGRLAGGVAHDFNNLMTAVMGYGELLFGSLAPDDPRRADVAEIQRAAARAGELTQQLLAFARRKEVSPRRIDVAAQLHGIERLVTSLVGPQVRLECRIAPDLPPVLIDPTQFDQVIMNLAVNARDAMPGGGTLRIAADRAAAGGVRLVVSDEGTGMTPEVLARVFEPFFTTKPVGQGTGLGLSTVHGVVHQAGGRIDVESAPGRGTTFRIDLPAAPDDAAADAAAGATPAPA